MFLTVVPYFLQPRYTSKKNKQRAKILSYLPSNCKYLRDYVQSQYFWGFFLNYDHDCFSRITLSLERDANCHFLQSKQIKRKDTIIFQKSHAIGHLQLPKDRPHFCVSIGKSFKSIAQEATIFTLNLKTGNSNETLNKGKSNWEQRKNNLKLEILDKEEARMERHRRTEKEHLKLETLNKRKVRMELYRRTETGAFEIRDLG